MSERAIHFANISFYYLFNHAICQLIHFKLLSPCLLFFCATLSCVCFTHSATLRYRTLLSRKRRNESGLKACSHENMCVVCMEFNAISQFLCDCWLLQFDGIRKCIYGSTCAFLS
jgi:hypothetical protein